jgi:hypothetical protein
VLVAVAAAVVLVTIGRLERGNAGDEANRGIAAVRALVGDPLAPGRAEAYFQSGGATCFLYTVGARPFGVSLCYDDAGRLVESTDDRNSDPHVWAVRPEGGLASERVDPRRVQAVVDALARRALVAAFETTTLFVFNPCVREVALLPSRASGQATERTAVAAVTSCHAARAGLDKVLASPQLSRVGPPVRRAVEAHRAIVVDVASALARLRAALGADGPREQAVARFEREVAAIPARTERAGALLAAAVRSGWQSGPS